MEKLVIESTNGLEFVGMGTNAKVYKNSNGDVIKVYKKYIDGEINKAPNLNKLKIYLMSKRRDKLKNNELPKGIVFIGDKVSGVLYNYQIGDDLLKLKKTLPFDKKVLCAKILVEKSKELTDNKIYCLDYKLNNVVYNDFPHFIDLDDWLTKYTILKNRKYLKETLYRLREMILELIISEYNKALQKNEKEEILSKYDKVYKLTKKRVSYDNVSKIIDELEKSII